MRVERRLYAGLAIPLLLSLGLACGPEVEPPPVPKPIPPDNRHPLEKAGMTLYRGATPPGVDGDFYLDAMQVTYDDLQMFPSIVNYTYHFSNQASDNSVEIAWEADGGIDVATGLKGDVEGSDDCLTVWINVSGIASSCEYVMQNTVSGCIASDGIHDWQLGFTMVSKTGSGCDALVPEDHRRVIKESDRLAARL